MLEALWAEHQRVLATIGFAVAAAGAFAYREWRRRNTPAARERRRRLRVNAAGRITHGTVIDFDPSPDGSGRLLHYTYSIGGVDYDAAQDISTLLDCVGDDPARIIGTANVKYLSGNPFNSIVVCEDWSGLRVSTSKSDPPPDSLERPSES